MTDLSAYHWTELFDELNDRASKIAAEAGEEFAVLLPEMTISNRTQCTSVLLAMHKRAGDLKKNVDRLLEGANPRGKTR